MARYQTLPDRVDCVCVTVNDQVGCLNYGNTIDCCIIYANTKSQLNVIGTSCTWTVPPGVCSFFVEIWGAGGGGSGGHGFCLCCAQGVGGGSGGYFAATIPTMPGCQYTICGGAGGTFGCGAVTGGGTGQTSYLSGFNAGGACATGGVGMRNQCNNACSCYGQNNANPGYGYSDGNTVVKGNIFTACGEVGHQFGQAAGCRHENRGGAAPFNGGTGGWQSYSMGSIYNQPGFAGGFPGGGGSGGFDSCCCDYCTCGGCGGRGLVRIWY